MNSDTNGQSAQDTPGNKGRQEAQGQEHLQQQTRASDGSPPRKRDRILYVENSSNIREPFVLEKIATVEELTSAFCERFPSLCIDAIGLKISGSRMGTMHRETYTDIIPYHADTLYITLYLKKHSL